MSTDTIQAMQSMYHASQLAPVQIARILGVDIKLVRVHLEGAYNVPSNHIFNESNYNG
jgi:hypothetical protein